MLIDNFLSLFDGVKKSSNGWMAFCPVHEDHNASLSITIGNDNKIMLHCFGGCETEDILNKIGLNLSDLFNDDNYKPINKIYKEKKRIETKYTYYDKNGNYLYDSVRIDEPGKKKYFQFMIKEKYGLGNINKVLYNLHKIDKAITNKEIIFYPEGEKCCNALEKIGLLGTTNPNGASGWKDQYAKMLTWANVVIIPDNDRPGESLANEVAESIVNCAESVKILYLPNLKDKEDVANWIDQGGTKDELLKLVEETPVYQSPKNKQDNSLYHYDKDKKEYLLENQRCWLSLNEGQFKKNLINLGYSDKIKRGQKLSEIDLKLIELRENHDIDYVGELAGYSKGFYEINDKRLLVTEGPKIINPKKGEYGMVHDIIDNLLTVDGDPFQISHFLYWLKIAYESLVNKTFRPGHALVLAGEQECGKSLLQKIITVILGGRSARPYKAMMGKTEFNSELFRAEHLMIEDEIPFTDIHSRRQFGAEIKKITSNDEHACYPKYRTPMTLRPFWRLSISLNDEPENIMILPPIDDSIYSKVIILRTYKKPMPMPTAKNEDRVNFWNKIIKQLPAFIDFLLNIKMEKEFISERYGVNFYHNQYVLKEIDRHAPENKLLNLIDIVLFDKENMTMTTEYEYTDLELINRLLADSNTKNETQKLLSHNTACNTYLARLAKKHPERVETIKSDDQTIWKLKMKK